ncbi:hypothetical protein PSOL_05470 [Candidatus Phytoplasma solani]
MPIFKKNIFYSKKTFSIEKLAKFKSNFQENQNDFDFFYLTN